MIIDTHCHLIDEAFTSDVEACILRAQEQGVEKMMLACCDETEFPKIIALCTLHPGVLYPSIGIHPENMAADIEAQLQATRSLLDSHMGKNAESLPLAIGEIGIDLHWDKTRLKDQMRILEAQLDWALEYDLPVMLHIRDAMQEFLDFLRQYIYIYNNVCADKGQTPHRLQGVMHCYSGTAEEADEANTLADLYIGVGGTVTYKKSKVPDVALAVGLDRIILETDAPYLAPVPKRGQRNEPAFTAHTAAFLAQLFDTTPEEVTETTTRNARQLFRI